MITPTIADRNMKIAVEQTVKRHDLSYFSYRDGVNPKAAVIIALSVMTPVFALIGGGAFGYLLAVYLDKPGLSMAAALLIGPAAGLLTGLIVLRWLLDSTAPSYDADFDKPGDVPTGRSFAPAANNPGRRVSLSESDKQLLQVFARRYPMVKTLAVNEWEGGNSPLVFPWISKRDAIERIQTIVINLEYGTRGGRGGVRIKDAKEFEGRIIPMWQNGVFDGENDE